MLGFIAAWMLLRWMAKTNRVQMSGAQADDFVTLMVVGVLVGGRVGHVLLYDQSLLWTTSSSFPFWGLLAIHQGGMSSHGGMAGVLIAATIFASRNKIKALHMLDCSALICCPGLMFGRLANWVNGELIGCALPAADQVNPPWWSVKYPNEVLEGTFDVSKIDFLRPLVPPNQPWPDALVWSAYEGNEKVITAIEPHLTAYYPSNFIQAFTDGPILFGVLCVVWMKPRKPGVIAGWFLLVYGLLREITEQYRAPDVGVTMIGSMTLPMFISIVMVVIGSVMVVICARRKVDPIGGLCAQNSR